MMRVYATLKARLLDDQFAAGERLDPARLSDDLSASVTPIRDALHRLTGERLIESWQQEGFRVPLMVDAEVRDLYAWNEALSGLLVHLARHRRDTPQQTVFEIEATSDADFFSALAVASGNDEAVITIAHMNDRLGPLRRREMSVLDGADETETMHRLLLRYDWRALTTQLRRYHRRRLRAVSSITAAGARRVPV